MTKHRYSEGASKQQRYVSISIILLDEEQIPNLVEGMFGLDDHGGIVWQPGSVYRTDLQWRDEEGDWDKDMMAYMTIRLNPHAGGRAPRRMRADDLDRFIGDYTCGGWPGFEGTKIIGSGATAHLSGTHTEPNVPKLTRAITEALAKSSQGSPEWAERVRRLKERQGR